MRGFVGRMSSGPRGAGVGVKLLIGAGVLAYGIKEATYTGTAHVCELSHYFLPKWEHLWPLDRHTHT